MRRFAACLLLASAVTLPARSQAAVHVRVLLSPDTLATCSTAHLSSALWNDGRDTLDVRVTLSLVFRDSIPLGTLLARTRLLPGQARGRETDLPVPAGMPLGSYALTVRALGSDGSSDVSHDTFVVVDASCPATSGGSASTQWLSALGAAVGVAPDSPTPTVSQTWGQLKLRYH
jgi:hypothetical protein